MSKIVAISVNVEFNEVYIISWLKFHRCYEISETRRALNYQGALDIGSKLASRYGVDLVIE